jgi:nicotinamide-nucleotide amidase
MSPKNHSQAYIPAGAEVLDNPLGTAPGFWSRKDRFCIAAVPGVPSEMKHMFTEQVNPRIRTSCAGPVVVSGQLRCFGAGESDIAQKLGDLMERERNPLINCTCGSGDIILHIIATANDRETAQKMVEKEKKALCECLGEWVYGQEGQSLSVVVNELLKKNHKTIALAESCTGGMLSQILTDIPGASDTFLAGWVTYSNGAKISQLGIGAEIIDKYGAVSEPVACMMAAQSAKKTGANIGVGITGIAGPGGGTEEKPVGLVYIAVQFDDKCIVRECRFPPTGRQWIRLRSALTALNMIRLQFKV